MNLVNALFNLKLAESKGMARRLIIMGAVRINGFLVNDIDYEMKDGDIIEVGKTKKAIYNEKKE